MNAADHHDDHHAVHPLSGALVVLVIAGLFGLLFSAIAGGWVTPVILIVAILAAWGLASVLILDKD